MILIDKDGNKHENLFDVRKALRGFAVENDLVSIDYDNFYMHTPKPNEKREIFYIGNPKFIGTSEYGGKQKYKQPGKSPIVVPVKELKDPRDRERPTKQVLEILIKPPTLHFMYPNVGAGEDRFRHNIGDNIFYGKRYTAPRGFRQYYHSYKSGRASPNIITLHLPTIEEQLKEVGFTVKSITPYKLRKR